MSYSYSTLTTAIKNHAEDQGATFAANTDAIIAAGEDVCVRDLPLDPWYYMEAFTIAQGSQLVTPTAGWARVGAVAIISGSNWRFLKQRTLEYLVDYWPNSSLTDEPKYWAYRTSSTLLVAPAADVAYPGSMRLFKLPTGLSGSNTTTWLGTHVGDMLLAACMISAEAYGMGDERIPMWKALYQERLASARREFRHLMKFEYDMPG